MHSELAHCTALIGSFHHRKNWEEKVIRLPSPFISPETSGPMEPLRDGSILLTISVTPQSRGPARAAVLTSEDRGATWKLISTIRADHNLDEANATQLPDGTLLVLTGVPGDLLLLTPGTCHCLFCKFASELTIPALTYFRPLNDYCSCFFQAPRQTDVTRSSLLFLESCGHHSETLA